MPLSQLHADDQYKVFYSISRLGVVASIVGSIANSARSIVAVTLRDGSSVTDDIDMMLTIGAFQRMATL